MRINEFLSIFYARIVIKQHNTIDKNIEDDEDDEEDVVINDESINLFKTKCINYFNSLIQNKDFHTLLYSILIGLLFFSFLLHALHFTSSLISSVIYLDYMQLEKPLQSLNTVYIILIMAGPIIVWLLSTNSVFWNYHNRKFMILNIIYFTSVIKISAMVYMCFYQLFIPAISSIKITEDMTANMIIGLGYITCALPTFIIFIAMMVQIKHLYNRYTRMDIDEFKLKHYVNTKRYSKYAYDLCIVSNMKTGKKIIIREHERFTHAECTGATGTAKTSSTLEPAINNDLITRVKNEDAQKKEIFEMLKKGQAYVKQPFEDEDYNINYIEPYPQYQRIYDKIKSKYKMCGILVVAPNPSLTDDVYNLCESKNIRCKRIDPRRINGELKPGFCGFNPLYISPSIPENELYDEIVKRSTLVADVFQAIIQLSGDEDVYFSGVNRRTLTSITTLLLLTFPKKYPGKQPTLKDVQKLLNDFNRIAEYYEILLKVDTDNNFISVQDYIRTQILEDENLRMKLEKECNGIRNLLDSFLMDRGISNIMCAENTIDLDEALEKGEIIVCNIELGKLGNVNSAAFGLFFTLSYTDAVLRRPGDEWTRLPNFCYIDEFPIIANGSLERCFSLFRQFRSAMFVAIQTLEQMNKNDMLRSLKGVILNSCTTHIVFGRTTVEDMQLFSKLDGEKYVQMEQSGVSQTSMTVENPTLSETQRYSMSSEVRTSETSLRFMDFQEVNLVISEDGRPLHMQHGKVFFLTKKEKAAIPRFTADWNKYYIENHLEEDRNSEIFGEKESISIFKEQKDVPFKKSTSSAANTENIEKPQIATVADNSSTIESTIKMSDATSVKLSTEEILALTKGMQIEPPKPIRKINTIDISGISSAIPAANTPELIQETSNIDEAKSEEQSIPVSGKTKISFAAAEYKSVKEDLLSEPARTFAADDELAHSNDDGACEGEKKIEEIINPNYTAPKSIINKDNCTDMTHINFL